MVNIEVKPFVTGQENIVCKIHNRAFDPWIKKLGSLYEYKEITSNQVSSWLKKPKNAIWLGYLDDGPVGYVHCSLKERTGNRLVKQLLFVETKESLGQSKIAVLPSFRHKGVAKALITQVLDHYKALAVETALVLAYSTNQLASQLLTSLGFEHKPFFFYEPYSKNDPYSHDSVLAELDLTVPICSVPLNNKVKIRFIRKEDLPVMRTIFGECRPDVFGPDPTMEQVESWFYSGWGEITLVAELDGEAVGCMEFTSKGLIGIPGVLKQYQRKGIGSTLFYHLLTTMQEKGLRKALADTGFILEDAIRMYQRFNFDLSRELWSWVKIV